jgi:hypothetical protein
VLPGRFGSAPAKRFAPEGMGSCKMAFFESCEIDGQLVKISDFCLSVFRDEQLN